MEVTRLCELLLEFTNLFRQALVLLVQHSLRLAGAGPLYSLQIFRGFSGMAIPRWTGPWLQVPQFLFII